MKKKIDFVTNSSSTSFIVANKDKKLCFGKVKIELEVDFVDLLNSVDRYEVFTTEEEILDYYDGYEPSDFEKMKKIIKNGGEIIVMELESTGKLLEKYLLDNGLKSVKFKNKNIQVIFGEGGY